MYIQVIMQTGRRFRLYPSAEQASVLNRWIGSQRFVYNAKVDEYRYLRWLRSRAILSPGWDGPDPGGEKLFNQSYSHFRNGNDWMGEIPSQVLRNGACRYRQAVIKCARGAGVPRIRHKHSDQSVLLTVGLFRFVDGKLHIGTPKCDLGPIRWVAHRQFEIPNMISITRQADGKWYVGFCCDDGLVEPQPGQPGCEEELLAFDLGVARAVTGSDGSVWHPTEEQEKKEARNSKRIRGLQKNLSRKKKGSANRRKARAKLGRAHGKARNLRREFAHQTSHRLTSTPHKAVAFEDIKLASLTARAAPKPNTTGTGYDPNGASAKSALNRSLLSRSLGMIRSFSRYKAARRGKSFLTVSAAYTSQRCPKCGHTDPLNRPSQAEFNCQACGLTDNADHIGAINIRRKAWIILRPPGTDGHSPVEGPQVPAKQEALTVR